MAKFTDEQIAAIEAQGRTIVSASAGSGKTTVMIEKIIRLIQSGCRVDEILAVTFTKKAAAQMKEKLCKALIETINAPETAQSKRTMLKARLSEVPFADISTIHSFCSKLIRSHFFAAGVDNGFRVIGGDDAEGQALKNEALDEVFEEGYEAQEEKFAHLLSVYWRKKSDNALRKIFNAAYEELRARADYREYLERSGKYDEQTFMNICADLHTLLKEKCGYYLDLVDEELYYFNGIEAAPQIALATELKACLAEILASPDYFAACAVIKPKFTAKRTSKKDSEEKKAHIERLAALKEKIVKIFDDELSATASREEELGRFLNSAKTAEALAAYLLRFDEKYAQLKTERGVLDYNDLEHKALALLKQDEIVAEMKEKYRFVFVDEYQDVNPVQEEIVSRLSGENLFLVGDVKQSIYGFRGSKSRFFVEKQKAFANGKDNALAMTRNFRSSDAVLNAVNAQFALAMTTKTGDIDYDEKSYMHRGGRYEMNSGKVAIHFFGKTEKEPPKTRGVYSVRARAGKKETAESAVAKMIRHIIEEERHSVFFDADEGRTREVRYSDIAILSRKKQGQIAKTVAALAAEDVPVSAASAVNICEYAEIKTLIDILSLIDNAEQDVPLCSALLSAMGDCTADDLTEIRLAYPKEKFFRNACKLYAAEKQDVVAHKLNKFFAYFEKLRCTSRVLDAAELLTKILSETRMEARLLTRENGVASLRRIHRFIEEASAEPPLCVHAFLDRLRDLDFDIQYSENRGEDSVKILTMHSSKGLEYPIVILDNLSAPFKGGDRDEVFVEERYGLAPKSFDGDKMTRANTLLRRLHELTERKNSIADELNLYYVALTRAKYGAHLLFESKPALPDVKYARSFADFTDFSVWEQYITKDEFFDIPKQERQALAYHPDEELTKGIMNAFLWEYPYGGYENLPVKSSATALMQGAETPRTEEELIEHIVTDGLFDEESKNEADSVALGLAYHAFLENFDFSALLDNEGKPLSSAQLEKIVAAAYEKALARGDGAELLSQEKLKEILSNPVFLELKGMDLYRERQFLVSLPVAETYALRADMPPDLKTRTDGEEMLFQGAIDLLAIAPNGKAARIIDYKYSGRGKTALREHYAPQLRLYKMATAKILGIPQGNIRCTIVNIRRGFEVEMD